MLITFPENCLHGRMLRRVKRFSVEFEAGGQRLWAHTNNSGSMLGLVRAGLPLLLSQAPGAARKLPYTLELVQVNSGINSGNNTDGNGTWVGVNTMMPNRLLKAAFAAGRLPWAAGYTEFKPESRRGQSRLDALLTGPGLPPLWVECKNVTLVEDNVAAFPDAVSERAQKHLLEMEEIVKSGERAAFFYCIQRNDAACFSPADYVDARYAEFFHRSRRSGVEAYPHEILVSPAGLDLGRILPIPETKP